jgi:hypothetical protein
MLSSLASVGGYVTEVGWLICASYNLLSFRFVEAKRRQNDNDKTTKRKVDKTTKLGQKDDKLDLL